MNDYVVSFEKGLHCFCRFCVVRENNSKLDGALLNKECKLSETGVCFHYLAHLEQEWPLFQEHFQWIVNEQYDFSFSSRDGLIPVVSLMYEFHR